MNTTDEAGSRHWVSNQVGNQSFTVMLETQEALSAAELILVTVMILISVIGTIGNVLIVYAVITQQELRRMTGNIFICNLALADLIVTALLFPITAANMLNHNKSVVSEPVCAFLGFLLVLSCNASIENLMFISAQRLAVTNVQKKKLLKRPLTTFLTAIFIWCWSTMLVSPLLIRQPHNNKMLLIYDEGASMCAWDDVAKPQFMISYITLAYFVPLTISILCYWILFQRVKRKATEMTMKSRNVAPQMQKREAKLLHTIVLVLVCFLVSWTPYCSVVLLSSLGWDFDIRNPHLKRPTSWLGMCNSSINSFIYGWNSKHFQRGYVCCVMQVADLFTCNRYKLRKRYIQKSTRKKQQYKTNVREQRVNTRN